MQKIWYFGGKACKNHPLQLFLVMCYGTLYSVPPSAGWSVPLRAAGPKGPMAYAFTHERSSPSPSSPFPRLPHGFDLSLETPNQPQSPNPSLKVPILGSRQTFQQEHHRGMDQQTNGRKKPYLLLNVCMNC